MLSGTITPEEFVTLNEKIGGIDFDSNTTAARSVADAAALPIAYQAGIVGSGKNFGKLPIIDSRGYDEVYGNLALGQYGIHQIWRSFSERARIDAGNGGNHGNHVMWRYGYCPDAGDASAVRSGDGAVLPDDGYVAVGSQHHSAEGVAQRRAYSGGGDRRQAGWRGRPLLSDW